MAEQDSGGGLIQRLRVLWDRAAAAKLEADGRASAKRLADGMVAELGPSGQKAGAAQLRGLKREYENSMARIREQFARGLINQGQMEKMGAAAGKAFNNGILRQIDELRRKGELTDATYRKLTRTLKDTGTAGGRAMSALTGVATKLGIAVSAAMAIQWYQRTIRNLYELGTNVEETGDKFTITFGAMSDAVDRFIADQGGILGLTRTMGREMTATGGAIVQGMGASKEASADFSMQMVKLAGDLQSFHNVPIADTFGAIRSGLVGAWEPMDRFGIVLRQVDVDARAMADTGKTSAASLTQLEKSTAALNLMIERSGPAFDNARLTMNSTANQARRSQASFGDLKEEIAGKLMPVFRVLVTTVGGSGDAFAALASVMGTLMRTVLVPVLGLFSGISLALTGVARWVQMLAEIWVGFQRVFGSPADIAKAEAFAAKMDRIADSAWNATKGLGAATKAAAGFGGAAAGPASGAPVIVPPARDNAGAGTGMGAGAGDGADAPKEKTADELEAERIALLQRAARAGIVFTDELRAKEDELKARLRDGNLTLEQRLDIMDRLGQVRDAMGKDTADAVNTMGFAFSEAFQNIANGTMKMRDAFGLVLEGVFELDSAMLLLGKGTWKQIIENIKKEAKGEALKAGAHAITQVAFGIARYAVGDAAGGAAHFSSAKTFALAALKWAAIAGGAGLAGGASGNRGGRGATQNEDVGGSAADSAEKKKGPDIYLTIDGVDPDNPRHVRLVGVTARNYEELEGGTIHYQGRPAA